MFGGHSGNHPEGDAFKLSFKDESEILTGQDGRGPGKVGSGDNTGSFQATEEAETGVKRDFGGPHRGTQCSRGLAALEFGEPLSVKCV